MKDRQAKPRAHVHQGGPRIGLEAMNLASCLLGILSAALKESIVLHWQMRGVGAWVVGERDHLDESSEVT